MRVVRTMPAEMFGAVATRLGGRIRYITLGRNVVLAWRVKDAK